jgi:dTDP-4-amino-4,6-dideoxygalactose transaminase
MQALRRDELRAYLEEHGVRTLLQWGGRAVHQFKDLGFKVELPRTTLMTSRFIMLPMNTSLSDDDANYICDVIEQFHAKG